MKLAPYETKVYESVHNTHGGHVRMMGTGKFNAACNRLVKKDKLTFIKNLGGDDRFDMWFIKYE